MDFLTAAAYIAIIVLVIINTLLVRRMDVQVRGDEENEDS